MSAQIRLRPYQAQGIQNLFAAIQGGVWNPIASLPTGAGKTVVASWLANKSVQQGKRVVFVVDRLSLVRQTSKTFDSYGIAHGTIQGSNERVRPWEKVQIAVAQTLCHRDWPEADLIIVDECHAVQKAVAERIQTARKQREQGQKIIVLGLTATPMTRGLGALYGSVVSTTTTNKLTADGFLVPFRVYAASEPDMTGAVKRGGEWTKTEASKRAMPIIGDCVAEYLRHGKGKKFIAFGCDVKHCEEMHRQFLEAGVLTELYTYRTDEAARDALTEEFSKPDSRVRGLISVSALSKGFDVSDVEVIIMARPLTNSLAEHIQILGRGLRIHPGKTECIVLDHSGNCFRFWEAMHSFFESGAHELDDGSRKERAKPPKKERQPVKCPTCSCIHDPLPNCPACGHAYKKPRSVEHVEGSLQEVKGAKAAKPAPTTDQMRVFHAQLRQYATETGKTNGWVLAKFREKFNDWPPRNELPPMEPTPELRKWITSRNMAWAASKKKIAGRK